MKTQRGFTLIEIMLAVAILAILAAIAIPNLLNAINRSRQKRTMSSGASHTAIAAPLAAMPATTSPWRKGKNST